MINTILPTPQVDWWNMVSYLPFDSAGKRRCGTSLKVRSKRRDANKRARKARKKNR